jgi:hypothetical protein
VKPSKGPERNVDTFPRYEASRKEQPLPLVVGPAVSLKNRPDGIGNLDGPAGNALGNGCARTDIFPQKRSHFVYDPTNRSQVACRQRPGVPSHERRSGEYRSRQIPQRMPVPEAHICPLQETQLFPEWRAAPHVEVADFVLPVQRRSRHHTDVMPSFLPLYCQAFGHCLNTPYGRMEEVTVDENVHVF